MYNDKIEIESPYGHITISYGRHDKHRVRVLDIDGGMESATYIEEELQNEFYALNAVYAKNSLVQEFKKKEFTYKSNDHFTPTQEEVYSFFMVGRSKDKNEDEPVAQIKFVILKDGTIVTDSDYLPNDVNERAHDAMDVLEKLMGNKRIMTKKEHIPAKYLSKMKPRRIVTINQK